MKEKGERGGDEQNQAQNFPIKESGRRATLPDLKLV